MMCLAGAPFRSKISGSIPESKSVNTHALCSKRWEQPCEFYFKKTMWIKLFHGLPSNCAVFWLHTMPAVTVQYSAGRNISTGLQWRLKSCRAAFSTRKRSPLACLPLYLALKLLPWTKFQGTHQFVFYLELGRLHGQKKQILNQTKIFQIQCPLAMDYDRAQDQNVVVNIA